MSDNPDSTVLSSSAKQSVLKSTKKKVITILLIGETGCGKTTFMSLLANLLHGKGPFELTSEHDKTKESGLSVSQSQTNEATMYAIQALDGTTIRILDTPGLADTRGLDTDNEHMKKINAAIQKHVQAIDAIMIMTNGSVERLQVATNYTLSTIAAMFPRGIIDNIGFVFTRSTRATWKFHMESLPAELQNAEHWLVENPLASWENVRLMPEDDEERQEERDKLEVLYKSTLRILNKWMAWLDERLPQPTTEIEKLYQTSARIESDIDALFVNMANMTKHRGELKRFQSAFTEARDNKIAAEQLQSIASKSIWSRKESTSNNMICAKPGCNVNCHESCHCARRQRVWIPPVGILVLPSLIAPLFYYEIPCAVAFPEPSKPCSICDHDLEDHQFGPKINNWGPQEVPQNIMEKFDACTNEADKAKLLEDEANKMIADVQAKIEECQASISDRVEEFNGVSLSGNFARHIHGAIKMLKTRQESLKSRTDTGTELELIAAAIEKFKKKLVAIGAHGEDSV